MYPDALKSWLSCNVAASESLYLVGGTVRDLLLGDQPKDIDLVCRDAKDFAYRLGKSKKAAVVPMEKKPAEPCYRVIDREHPDNFLDIAEMRGQTIYDDLGRRDFTINAIASEVREDGTIGPLLDPFSGAKDLKLKTIKMTGYGSFVSDPLRILRAARFSATLRFTIEPQTIDEMRNSAALLQEVSGERIMAELLLILKTPHSASFIKDMDHLGILDILFPEIPPMKGCQQNGFHHKDVWEHSLLVAKNCEEVLNDLAGYFGDWAGDVSMNLEGNNRRPMLKLTALLHDIGKPLCRGVNEETGRIIFYRHDKEGSELAEAIAERLKLSSQDRNYMVQLIAEHMHVLSLAGHVSRTAARMRWFRKMKDNAVPAIILGIADVVSSLGKESTVEWRNHYLEWSKDIVREYYETIRPRLESKNLITGTDLISLGVEPGPEMGRLLDILRNAQDTGEISSREDALALAKSLLEKI
jgi:putative nucleotidyltransferase with HDIG domain